MSELFGPGFLDLLQSAMRRVRTLRAQRSESELRARKTVGAARGAFAGHRPYSPGVDVRDVDWAAYARSRELYAKTFEEDEHRTLTIFLDTTPSMRAGDRFDGARRLAALLGALVLARLDAVRLVTVGAGPVEHAFEFGRGLQSMLEVLRSLEATCPPAAGDPAELARVPIERSWTGSFVWISDFADPDAFAPALQRLRSTGRRCTGVLPRLESDLEPAAILASGRSGGKRRKLQRLLEVVDPESGARETLVIDEALSRALRKELEQLRRRQLATFAQAGAGNLLFVPLPKTGDFRLDSWVRGDWISHI